MTDKTASKKQVDRGLKPENPAKTAPNGNKGLFNALLKRAVGSKDQPVSQTSD